MHAFDGRWVYARTNSFRTDALERTWLLWMAGGQDWEDQLLHHLWFTLAQVEILSNIAISKALSHQPHDVFFPATQEVYPFGINNTEVPSVAQGTKHVLQFLRVGPYLSSVDLADAFAQQIRFELRAREHPSCTFAHCFNHELWLVKTSQKTLRVRFQQQLTTCAESEALI